MSQSAIPVTPVLTWKAFKITLPSKQACQLIGQRRNKLLLPSSQIALANILSILRVGPNHKILLPAYYPADMLEPINWFGVQVDFYTLNEDLSPNIHDIESRIDSHICAVIGCHYFGFPQDLKPMRELCDNHKLTLIEDCSHCSFSLSNQDVHFKNALANTGEYAVVNPSLFFPLYDGAYLISNISELSNKSSHSLGAYYQLSSITEILQNAHQFGHLNLLKPITLLLEKLKNSQHNPDFDVNTQAELYSDSDATVLYPGNNQSVVPTTHSPVSIDPRFRQASIDSTSSIFSRISLLMLSHQRVIKKRRKNYKFLYSKFSRLAKGRPIMAMNKECEVPYVFPLQVDDPQTTIPRLLDNGVPIVPWNNVNQHVCSISTQYSQSLVLLPCHQECAPKHLLRLASRVGEILAR